MITTNARTVKMEAMPNVNLGTTFWKEGHCLVCIVYLSTDTRWMISSSANITSLE
ncbi:MAG: hypothetical protein ACJ70W_05675 [Nitrososphaera sp.]